MRVLHVIWSMELGGAESMLVDLANRQVGQAEVGVLVGNAVVDESLMATLSPDVSVLRIDRPPGSRNPWHLYRLNRAVRGYRPDIIHSHSPALIAMLPRRDARCVLTVHDTGIPLSALVDRYDLIVSISHAVRADLLARPSPVPSIVISNGIDFGALRPRAGPRRVGPVRLVQVSRLVQEKKGQDILLDAVRAVVERRGPDAVTVDFIGEGPDRAVLEQRASELGVTAQCRFVGPMARREVYRVLPGYDVLVQPSRYEGFGLTIVEGVAAGLAVLVSDTEGPREIVRHMPHGYVFAPGDAVGCAAQLLRILDDLHAPDHDQRRAADRAALASQFDIAGTVAAYLGEYTRLAVPGRRRA